MNTTPIPDYGEPWEYGEGAESDEEGWWHRHAIIWDRNNHTICKERRLDDNIVDEWSRIVTCVNACAGMADPAAEIEAMREAIQIAKDLAEWSARYPRDRIYSASNRQMDAELIELEERAKAAAAKLQPFIKP